MATRELDRRNRLKSPIDEARSEAKNTPPAEPRFDRFAVATVVGLLTCGLGPLVILLLAVPLSGGPAPAPAAVAVQVLVIVYAGGRLAGIAARGRPAIFGIAFWVFVYVWMGIAPLAQLLGRSFPPLAPGYFTAGVTIEANIVVLVGLLAFDLGCILGTKRNGAVAVGRFFESREVVPRRAIALGLFVVVASPLFIAKLGGLQNLFVSRTHFQTTLAQGLLSEANKSTGVFTVVLAEIPAFGALFVLWQMRKSESIAPAHRRAIRLLLPLLALVNLLFNNPIITSRYLFGTIALSFVFMTTWMFRPAFVRCMVVGAVLAASLAFSHADYFRTTGGHVTQVTPMETLQTGNDYDAQQEVRATVLYTRQLGHTMGRQLLGPVLFWYPRALWSGKPEDTGIVLARFRNYPYTNVSGPLWAESFMDFGYLGVGLYFVGLGWLLSALDDLFVATRRRGDRLNLGVLVSAVFAGYLFIILRGSLLQAMAQASVLALVFAVLSRRRSEATVRHLSKETGSVGGREEARPTT